MSDRSSSVPSPAEAAGSIGVAPGSSFVLSPPLQALVGRASSYLRAGYSIHLRGPAGTGKTTLALHLAHLRGRPVMLMQGDDELGSSDLVGGDRGYQRSQVVDNFVRSVVKTRETVNTLWTDNRLTQACQNGATLVYDEFNRSRPEANNALLSVLEERIINLPRPRPSGETHVAVHRDFRAVCTSNSEEYAGVHRAQDALLDRLLTLYVDHHDRETEIAITRAKSGVTEKEAAHIVDIVRDLRALSAAKQGPSLRACIMIARISKQEEASPRPGDRVFRDICRDVLGGTASRASADSAHSWCAMLDELLAQRLGRSRRGAAAASEPRA